MCYFKSIKEMFIGGLNVRERRLVESHLGLFSHFLELKYITILLFLRNLGRLLIGIILICVSFTGFGFLLNLFIIDPSPYESCDKKCCDYVWHPYYQENKCDDNKTLESFCEQDCSKYSKTRPDSVFGEILFEIILIGLGVIICVLFPCTRVISDKTYYLIEQVIVRDQDEKTALLHRPLIKGRDCKDVEVRGGGSGGGGGKE